MDEVGWSSAAVGPGLVKLAWLLRVANSLLELRRQWTKGRKRHKSLRRDWKQVRETVMTRGIYVRCRTHPELAEALLDTGDTKIVENSNFDYFWGCGRDRRGDNRYGKVLMNVRARLREERAAQD